MKPGTVVQTEYGRGVIVNMDGASRYRVLLDEPHDGLDENLKQMHQRQSGLCFWEKELSPALPE